MSVADPEHTVAAQGISTPPGKGALDVDTSTAFLDQIIGTAILLVLVLPVTDAPVARMAPFIVGPIVVATGMAWGTAAGHALDPARDFGPRRASFLTGHDTAFHDQPGSPCLWSTTIGPLTGGVPGARAYQLLIARYVPPEDEPGIGKIPTSEPRVHPTAAPPSTRTTRTTTGAPDG